MQAIYHKGQYKSAMSKQLPVDNVPLLLACDMVPRDGSGDIPYLTVG